MGFVENDGLNYFDLLGMRGYSPSEFGLNEKCWICEADDDWVLKSLTSVRFVSKKPTHTTVTKISSLTVEIGSAKTRNDGSVEDVDTGGLIAFSKVEVTYSFDAIGIYSFFEAVYCTPKFPTSIFFSTKRFKGDLLGLEHYPIALYDREEYRLSPNLGPNDSESTMELASQQVNKVPKWDLPEWKGDIKDVIRKNMKEDEEIRVRKPEKFK